MLFRDRCATVNTSQRNGAAPVALPRSFPSSFPLVSLVILPVLLPVLAFVFSLGMFVSTAKAAEDTTSHSVLVLYSSQDVSIWENQFTEALFSALPIDTLVHITLEFLPLNSIDDEQKLEIAETLTRQQNTFQPDLIIAIQPAANEFLFNYGNIFANGAQRLYVLPSDELIQALSQNASSVVLESAIKDAARNTLNVMPDLLPNLEHVYVIGGGTDADLSYMSRVRSVIDEDSDPLEYVYLEGLTTTQLESAVRNIPANSAILLSTYDADSEGNIFRTGSIPEIIGGAGDIPVFAIFNSILGFGPVVGGNITSASQYGQRAAHLALEILDDAQTGESPGEATQFVFDAAALRGFDINLSALPQGSQILNYEPSVWEEYWLEILLVGVVIVIQAMLIVALLLSLRNLRAARSKIIQTQKMEALGNLSGGVAHDFNNVLMAIVSNAELAKLSAKDNPATTVERLQKVLTASGRAKDIVSQILLFSRHSEKERFATLRMSELLEETAGTYRTALPDNIYLELDYDPELWSIHADSTQIQQILLNLWKNSEHAMSEGGSIVVRASNAKIERDKNLFQQVLPKGDYVAISVADSGTGIRKKHIARIFEPFYTTKPEGKGTGLGLALVYEIVKSHQGYLDIESMPKRGTAITLYFPAKKLSLGELSAEQDAKIVPGDKELILLVDDDAMTIDGVGRMLEHLGYEVRSFTSPIKALRHLREEKEHYSLLISDLSMPEMDGIRLISNVRAVTPKIPVILLTAYIDSLNQYEVENLGDVTVLRKPSSLVELSIAARDALRNTEAVEQRQAEQPHGVH